MTSAATTADIKANVALEESYKGAVSAFNEQTPMLIDLWQHEYLDSDPGIKKFLTDGKKLAEMTPFDRGQLSPEAMDFITRHEQVIGKQFLAAYEQLKGAGPITDREGAAATAAVSRMQERGLSPENYRQALKEYYFHLENMIKAADMERRGVVIDPKEFDLPWNSAPPAPDATTTAPTGALPQGAVLD